MTPDQFARISRCSAERAEMWHAPMEEAMARFYIFDVDQQAAFLAQCAHESGFYRKEKLVESLYWTDAVRLRSFFSIFRGGQYDAEDYVREPEKLANLIYADANRSPKLALGNLYEGDGWKYIGRGPIQITGRYNYRHIGMLIDLDLEGEPQLVEIPIYGALAAAALWDDAGCNACTNFDQTTRKINPAMAGANERRALFEAGLRILT